MFSTWTKNDRPYTDEEAAYQDTIRARTEDGMWLLVDMSVHYRVTTKDSDDEKYAELLNIFLTFGEDWEPFLVAVADSKVRDVCGHHTSFEFFEDRVEIGQEIRDAISEEYAAYGFSVRDSEILNLEFPAEFEDAIQDTEIVVQLIEQVTFEMEKAEISATTRVLVSGINAVII